MPVVSICNLMLILHFLQLFILQEGREVVKKKTFVPPPRFFNIDEARYSMTLNSSLIK